jgi:hypothetical protein
LATLARTIDQSGARNSIEAREAHILVDGHFRHDPVLLPIFRQIADACLDRSAW